MNSKSLTALALSALLAACGGSDLPSSPGAGDDGAEEASAATEPAQPVEIVPGLTARELRPGTGAAAAPGQEVTVHYTGWLHDPEAPDSRGSKFDSSLDRGQPFSFPLGAGRVIQGWERGVAGMREGELRELTIAPELAYGNRNVGDLIPPDSTLVFEVELLDAGEPQPAQ